MSRDIITFNISLDSLCDIRALAIFRDNEMEFDTITYNSMINGFCKHNRLDDAKRIFDLMATKGCSPNVVTFNTLIDGCCRDKRVEDGVELLREMSRRGLVADTVSYNTLIHGFCQMGDLSAAHDLFDEMISHGVCIQRYLL